MSDWENDQRKWDVQDLMSGRNERYQDAGIPQPVVQQAEIGEQRIVVTQTQLWKMRDGLKHRAGGMSEFGLGKVHISFGRDVEELTDELDAEVDDWDNEIWNEGE